MANNIQVIYKEVKDLLPYAKNARTHPEAQIKQIVSSIRQFGFINPVIIDKNGTIVAGHGRIIAAKRLKMQKVPCITVDNLTEKQVRAYILADNKIALNSGWDEGLLKMEIKDLIDENFDMEVAGFTSTDLKELKLLDFDPSDFDEDEAETPDDFQEEHPELYQVRDDFFFTSNNQWGIPDLRSDMLYDGRIDDVSWSAKEELDPNKTYLILHGQQAMAENVTNNIIGYFVDDYRFENIYTDASAYVDKLLKLKPKALIEPDFSTWLNEPRAFHIMARYKSAWCARYWQEFGFKVIPCIEFADMQSLDYCLAGIPLEAPVVACQWRTQEGKEGISLKLKEILEAHERLRFKHLIIYGTGAVFCNDYLHDHGIDFSIIRSWSEAKSSGEK